MSLINQLKGNSPAPVKKPAPLPSSTAKPAAAPRAMIAQAPPRMTLAEKLAMESEERKKNANDKWHPLKRTFWIPKTEQQMIAILDHSLNDPDVNFSRRVHTLQDEDGHYARKEWCLIDMGIPCPVCKKTKKKSSFEGYLSILSFRSWKDGEGNEHVYSRKLMPVAGELAAELLKLEAKAVAKGKTLRGMVLTLERGKGEKTARTGLPVAFDVEGSDTPVIWAFLSEAEILQIANNPKITTKDGKVIKQAGEDTQPWNYRELFGEPDVEALEEEFGDGSPAIPGSKKDAREAYEAYEASASTEPPEDGDEIPGIDTSSPALHEEVEYYEPAEVVEAPRPVARPAVKPLVTARPVVANHKPVPLAPKPLAPRPVAVAPKPVAAAPKPVAAAPRPVPVVKRDPFGKK